MIYYFLILFLYNNSVRENILIIIIYLIKQIRQKKMEPKSKITRSKAQIKQKLKSKPKGCLQKTKYIHKGKKYFEELERLRKQKEKEKRQKSEQIVINMDLGQYGFDTKPNPKKVEEIQQLLKLCLNFSINPNIEGIEWKQMCNEITNKLKNKTYLLQSKSKHYLLENDEQRIKEISRTEKAIWECLHQLLVRIKSGSSSPGLAGAISDEISLIHELLAKASISLQKIHQIENWRNIEKINDELIQERSFKTFILGLGDHIIDELNYFLQRQIEQNSRNHNADYYIGNWLQWADFIQRKRVRLRKANKFLLHTGCQLCLSPYVEPSNQMIYCPECHMRGHRACLQLNTVNRCGRCIYSRLSNEMKQKVPECFICGVRGFIPMRINSFKFVHVFCLIAHNLWHVKQQKVQFLNTSEKQQNCNAQKTCKFCQKQSSFCVSCEKCNQYCHFLCAFMNGGCFTVDGNKNIRVTCCQLNSVSGQRLAYQRKYILNHDNIVFRKLNQIKRIQGIQKTRGKYRIKTKPKRNKRRKSKAQRMGDRMNEQIILSQDEFKFDEDERKTRKHLHMEEYHDQQ